MENPYAKYKPSGQQTLDIFAGKWVSKLPPRAGTSGGAAELFTDPRVEWARSHLQDFGLSLAGSSVLELGPLEGAHSYLLSQSGARSVTAIEANKESFLRCLVAKELLGVERVNFLYGDAVDYLRSEEIHFDIGFASGFLYHMTNPVEVIELLCKRCQGVFLWTMVWDHAFDLANPHFRAMRGVAYSSIHGGYQHTLHRHDYGKVSDYTQFMGGPVAHSCWMEIDEIVSAFKFFGCTRVHHEAEDTANGRALRLVAAK